MRLYLSIIIICLLASCQETFLGKDPVSTPRTNFESLWRMLDKKYSYFNYKGIDWNEVYSRYSPRVTDTMNDVQLFNVLFEMLSELRDSHVNLSAPFNVSRYEEEFTHSPLNFDERLVDASYLKNDYYITGPFKHQLLVSGTIGYVRYASFEDEITPGSIDFVTSRFQQAKGIIIDVRSNGGGSISNVFTLCSRFTDQSRQIYTSYLKNGPGHEDFAAPNNVFVSPAGITFTQKVCVLTNRGSYSAPSFFVLAMRNFPNVTIVGDTTGGGLGAPTGAELPNGWAYRFSCSRTLSPDGKNFESGIPPDVTISLTTSDAQRKRDSIIEKAISIILLGQ